MRFKQKIERILFYEYWPAFIFYLPFFPLWLIYSLRLSDWLYFTKVNPKMRFGGFMQYSKYDVIKSIPEHFITESYFFKDKPSDSDFYKEFLDFPLIFKPDIGERGKGVHLFKTEEDFKAFIPQIQSSFILQKYCDYPIELGILYHKFPNGKSEITSIVKKEFLYVIGDGQSTLETLVNQSIRAHNRIDYFAEKFNDIWQQPVEKNEYILLEEIGNHCRGTKFIDACELITPQLVSVFDEISHNIPDFHYGRFDLKVKSIEDLYDGKNIQIFELNGVNSEVAHIYDPKHSIFYAYRQVYKELKTVFTISKVLKTNGVQNPNTHYEFFKALVKQLRSAS